MLDRPTLSVNFDPANMVLYDKGDPIDALSTLGPWIGQVHIKDGIRTRCPANGARKSSSAPATSTGRRSSRRSTDRLHGDLCIEREAGTTRVDDIAAARVLVEGIQ